MFFSDNQFNCNKQISAWDILSLVIKFTRHTIEISDNSVFFALKFLENENRLISELHSDLLTDANYSAPSYCNCFIVFSATLKKLNKKAFQ